MRAKWSRLVERSANNYWTDWIKISGARHRIACCDCGLVHDLEFDEQDDAMVMRARRNMRSTAQMRRHRKSPRAPS